MAQGTLTAKDYEDLENADKINELIQRVASTDTAVSQNAILEADELLNKLKNQNKDSDEVGFQKTVINKDSDQSKETEYGSQQTSIEAFKSACSLDAAERAQQRKQSRATASEIKAQANAYFKVGDWEHALLSYTKAIEMCRDWPILYTNRAQAYLRVGRPQQALDDCEMSLRLFPVEPQKTPTRIGDDADAARTINRQVVKAYLHRGKALLTLRRSTEALHSYASARVFHAFTVNPATSVAPDSESDEWPPFLQEYVAQAKAALAAESLDSLAVVHSSSSNAVHSMSLKSTEERFIRLIAEAETGGRTISEYTSTLNKISKLLNSLNLSDSLPKSDENENGVEETIEENFIEPMHTGDQIESRNRRRKKKKTKARNKASPPLALNNDGQKAGEIATLAKLQSYFRTKKGFKMLATRMKRFDTTNLVKRFWRFEACPLDARIANYDEEDVLASLEHLIILITVSCQLVRDCGENQRLLVESMPQLLSTLLIDCLKVSPLHASSLLPPLDSKNLTATNDSKLRHLLGLLRSAACDLAVQMSSQASGREALITSPGPAVLLATLAICLSDSLGLASTKTNNSSVGLQTSKAEPKLSIADCFAVQTVAATVKIIENLTRSHRFLLMVRSTDCFEGLQNVIETAIAPVPGSYSSTAVPVVCLSQLIDSLSSVSDDPRLRRNMISKPKFLVNLANCAAQHVPFMTDESHTALVGSLCRLLHNFLTGEQQIALNRVEMEALLDLVGKILDQPEQSSALLSVSVALLGKFAPLCAADLVEKWSHSGKNSIRKIGNKQAPPLLPEIKERISILISTIQSHSSSSSASEESQTLPNGDQDTSNTESQPSKQSKVYESSASLLGHRLHGAVRALSVIAKASGCCDVRHAIGDNKALCYKFARLIRARVPPTGDAKVESSPRDEQLAANVCLILEACLQDTKMAENLLKTPIMMDLLQLIQDSKITTTKRNAACVIGRLTQANELYHREFSRLDGMSVVSHFGSWGSPKEANPC